METSDGLKVPIVKCLLWISVLVASIGIVAPVVFSFVWAFWGTGVPGLLALSPSLKWFGAFFSDPVWGRSLLVSAAVTLATLVASVPLVVLISFSGRLGRDSARFSLAILSIVTSAFPMLIYAMALRLSAAKLGIGAWPVLLIGYVMTVFPYIYVPMAARALSVPKTVLWSSLTLGAGAMTTLIRVFIPLVVDAIAIAGVIAVLLAWDELVMPVVLLDGAHLTVSRHLWDLIGSELRPYPAVVAVLTYGVGFSALLVALLFSSRKAEGEK